MKTPIGNRGNPHLTRMITAIMMHLIDQTLTVKIKIKDLMTTATDQQLAAQMMVQAKEGNIQDKGNGGAIVDSTIDHHR